MINKILNEIESELIEIRRTIHKNPELAFKEYKTSELIANYLRKCGIEVQTNIAKTGVVGLIRGNGEGKTLLLRADMDALPLDEQGTHSFVSQNSGIMHACGHDVHITTLLGAATVLSRLKGTFKGNIKLVFQPAEEGEGGALPMIDEGVLENPTVNAAFAYHIWDSIPTGSVMVKKGCIMAAPDHFHIKVIGKGGHGAIPQLCINPVEIGSQIVSALHKIKTDEPSVITICSFNGGNSENVIPDEVVLKGTARTIDEATRQNVYELIKDTAEKIALANGGRAELDYRFLYPPCINNDEMIDLFITTATEVIGKDKIVIQEKPDMVGEDFAYFAKNVPSCFVKLGGAKSPLHTSNFDVDENSIKIGASIMCKFAIDYLNY